MLVAMFRIARRNAPFQPIWVLPLADPAGAPPPARYTFTAPGVTGAAILWALGRRVVFQVNAADTAAQVATKAAARSMPGLPVTAAVDGTTPAKVNVTAITRARSATGRK
jgi:phage tail sheath gpL-like